ncbi:MAG: hypothetical protein ACLU9S_08960 [Oscillospiraceae bacterium]
MSGQAKERSTTMDSVYFNVSSITNAMGKNLLERNGIHGYINRTVDEEGNNGCGCSPLVMGYRQGGKPAAGVGHPDYRQGPGG